ncbi:hypothetical protein BpHYR1_020275 [Brachionus plicatilis]|uniref:Uncharacterized protein n=1 Tax=Brachionus plicatilis TaxID=10195 RepID=A0A3M7RYL6_BRAPC|nr:hypothetical protein BpHYR1_020275 [Brachionus plicatilis]
MSRKTSRNYHLVFIRNHFGLFIALKPHHVSGVKAPRKLFERLSGQELRFGALHRKSSESWPTGGTWG